MPIGGPSFSSVRKAREALKERAHEAITLYLDGMKQALKAGDFETFQKGMSDICKHIPEDDGVRVFDADVDKRDEGKSNRQLGPSIQIGVAIGGLSPTKVLPETIVIDVPIIDQDPPTDG